VTSTTAEREAQQLLTALTAGPDEAEHGRGLSTALPSDVGLRVTALRDGVAVVAIEGGEPDADPRRLPLSVAQVVLTLTSMPGVDAVRLTRDGEFVQAPLATGELVSRALTAADYRSLLARGKGTASPSATSSP
jgi:spore germination protein GerM